MPENKMLFIPNNNLIIRLFNSLIKEEFAADGLSLLETTHQRASADTVKKIQMDWQSSDSAQNDYEQVWILKDMTLRGF